ncbi:MAG: hypothetical protein ABSA83_15450 [Verrucomicrobiota bacterium]
MKKNIIFAVTLAGIVALAANARAGSPKGEAQAGASQKVAGTTPDMLDHSANSLPPRARQLVEASRAVLSASQDVEYMHAARPKLSPKDSRFETAWRLNAVGEIQIALLK